MDATATDPVPVPAASLLPWRSLPFPAPWPELFGSDGLLVVEVGFGDGRYTVGAAQAEPHKSFVGLEVSSGSVQRAMRRVKRGGVSNVRLLKCGAHVALRQLFAPGSIDTVIVNFPCPWPKERHLKHRLLSADFFGLVASRMAPAGQLRLATDHDEYLAFAISEAERSGLFGHHAPPAPPAVLETKYALKWREQGKALHYVVFERNGVPAPPIERWERPTTMPHALLHGTLQERAAFEKIVLPYGDGHVIVHEVAEVFTLPGERARWLFRATADEPELKQQLLVVAQQRADDEVIVRLEPFGEPLVTPTSRGCVHAVTDWLTTSVGLAVAARNY